MSPGRPSGRHSDPFLSRLLHYFEQQGEQPLRPIAHPDTKPADPQLAAACQLRQAAVLIPVMPPFEGQESRIILTVRTDHLRSHAGQVSFPGGTVDESDRDVVCTALRESEEEIGLMPEAVTILGQLGQIILPSGYCVTPVVGLLEPEVVLRPSPAEVAAIFNAPSSLLLDPRSYQRKLMVWKEVQRQILELHFETYRIWGATASILHHLGSELAQTPN